MREMWGGLPQDKSNVCRSYRVGFDQALASIKRRRCAIVGRRAGSGGGAREAWNTQLGDVAKYLLPGIIWISPSVGSMMSIAI